MNERLLQYIWQFQYFNLNHLTTQQGETISIVHPGVWNTHQGPDFLDAKIKIGQTTWVGNIELHIKSSDWKTHGHHDDEHYKNIILHVVWIDDVDLQLAFPVLELQHRISTMLLDKYLALMQAATAIPCQNLIGGVSEIIWSSWKQRLLVERLIQKSQLIIRHLSSTNNHWEEVFWRMLARNFGMRLNADVFEEIATGVPVSLLAKHKSQIHQLEALLLGQANILQGNFNDSYCQLLQKEYSFLQKKYHLQPVQIPLQYLRMRPSNFPTLRLAQLAMLVHKSSHLFSKIVESPAIKDIEKMLDVTANDYWHYHYRPDEASFFKKKNLGKQTTANILINTVIPVLFAYGHYRNENYYKEKAIAWLDEIGSESNSITKIFTNAGITCPSAFTSQAFIQLKNNYCDQKRCLECAVGNFILKRSK